MARRRLTPQQKIVAGILADLKVRQAIIDAAARAGQPLTRQAIFDWGKLKNGVPSGRVQTVARVLRIPPHVIRPDIFPPPRAKRAASVA
jgi:hypothetical protein